MMVLFIGHLCDLGGEIHCLAKIPELENIFQAKLTVFFNHLPAGKMRGQLVNLTLIQGFGVSVNPGAMHVG
jgi:hypothetical protein